MVVVSVMAMVMVMVPEVCRGGGGGDVYNGDISW